MKKTTEDHLQSLSALLYSPSALSWQRLVCALDNLSEEEQELLPRLEEVLSLWPDELRTVPTAWWMKENPSCGHLCRSLTIEADWQHVSFWNNLMERTIKFRIKRFSITGSNTQELKKPDSSLYKDVYWGFSFCALVGMLDPTLIRFSNVPALSDEDFTRFLVANPSIELPHHSFVGDFITRFLQRGELKLERLDLSDNQLRKLSEGAISVPNLKELRCDDMQLEEGALLSLIEALNNSKFLGSLSLKGNQIDDDLFEALLPYLNDKPIQHLYLNNNLLTHRSLQALSETNFAPYLETLELEQNQLYRDWWRLGSFPSLKNLDLSWNLQQPTETSDWQGASFIKASQQWNKHYFEYRPEAQQRLRHLLRNLSKLQNIKQLIKLSLREVGLQDDGLQKLLELPISVLESLDLSSNSISQRGLRALLTSNNLSNLRSLRLFQNPIGSSAEQSFQELPTLESLQLKNNQYQSESIWKETSKHWLKKLQHLDLAFTGIDTQDLQSLLQALEGGNLQSLNLARNFLGPEGLSAFCINPSSGPLNTLVLQNCGLIDDSLSALIECPHLGQLRVLDLSENELSDEAIVRLLESSSLAHLSELYLGRDFTVEAVLPAAAKFGRSLTVSCRTLSALL
jgi:Leucine-rich repeat (LRR) protein